MSFRLHCTTTKRTTWVFLVLCAKLRYYRYAEQWNKFHQEKCIVTGLFFVLFYCALWLSRGNIRSYHACKYKFPSTYLFTYMVCVFFHTVAVFYIAHGLHAYDRDLSWYIYIQNIYSHIGVWIKIVLLLLSAINYDVYLARGTYNIITE